MWYPRKAHTYPISLAPWDYVGLVWATHVGLQVVAGHFGRLERMA